MWELEHKEGWALESWCFWTVVLEKTLESPLYCKEIKLVKPKGNYSWIFIGRTDAEAEAPIPWPFDANSRLIRKDLMLGKIEGRRRKGWQRTRWLDGITDSMEWVWANSRRWWRTGKLGELQSMGFQIVGHDWASEQQHRCFWRHKLIAAIILSVNNDSPKWVAPKWTALSLITCTGASDRAKSQIHVWTVQVLCSFHNHMLLSFQESPLNTCGIIYVSDSTVNPACLIQWFKEHFLVKLRWFHRWPWRWAPLGRCPWPWTWGRSSHTLVQ